MNQELLDLRAEVARLEDALARVGAAVEHLARSYGTHSQVGRTVLALLGDPPGGPGA